MRRIFPARGSYAPSYQRHKDHMGWSPRGRAPSREYLERPVARAALPASLTGLMLVIRGADPAYRSANSQKHSR